MDDIGLPGALFLLACAVGALCLVVALTVGGVRVIVLVSKFLADLIVPVKREEER